jgi:type II secretory pathway pseudopilin PulG
MNEKSGMKKSARRRGFSLLAVLIIAIIGMAIVGGVIQVTVASSSGSRTSAASSVKYNFLQHAVEEGKAAVKAAMDDDVTLLKYNSSMSTITSADELLVDWDFGAGTNGIVKSKTLSKQELGRLGITGNSGELVVRIYDMQYDPGKIPEVGAEPGMISPEQFSLLPPSTPLPSNDDPYGTAWAPDRKANHLTSDSTGVYLVRASLEVGGHETVLDSAIFHSNNKYK